MYITAFGLTVFSSRADILLVAVVSNGKSVAIASKSLASRKDRGEGGVVCHRVATATHRCTGCNRILTLKQEVHAHHLPVSFCRTLRSVCTNECFSLKVTITSLFLLQCNRFEKFLICNISVFFFCAAQGRGAKGQNEYEFSLEFLLPVKSEVRVSTHLLLPLYVYRLC